MAEEKFQEKVPKTCLLFLLTCMILVSSLTYKINVKQRSCADVNSPLAELTQWDLYINHYSEDELGEGRAAALRVMVDIEGSLS